MSVIKNILVVSKNTYKKKKFEKHVFIRNVFSLYCKVLENCLKNIFRN